MRIDTDFWVTQADAEQSGSEIQLFCVQTKAIQQYYLRPTSCFPPGEDQDSPNDAPSSSADDQYVSVEQIVEPKPRDPPQPPGLGGLAKQLELPPKTQDTPDALARFAARTPRLQRLVEESPLGLWRLGGDSCLGLGLIYIY